MKATRRSVKTISIPEQHKTEYKQICEHYRQGYRTMFDAARLYLLLQAGLATALGLVVSHTELQIKVPIALGLITNAPILVISLIGFASSPLALVTLQRHLLYYRCGIVRAIELEQLYEMKLMTLIHDRIMDRRTLLSSVNSARVLFVLIGLSWAFFIFFSFYR